MDVSSDCPCASPLMSICPSVHPLGYPTCLTPPAALTCSSVTTSTEPHSLSHVYLGSATLPGVSQTCSRKCARAVAEAWCHLRMRGPRRFMPPCCEPGTPQLRSSHLQRRRLNWPVSRMHPGHNALSLSRPWQTLTQWRSVWTVTRPHRKRVSTDAGRLPVPSRAPLPREDEEQPPRPLPDDGSNDV